MDDLKRVTRRRFLQTTAAAGGAFAFGADAFSNILPLPDDSGIEHIVVVMMENRSFDHFLGWMWGADGRQAGLTYYDSAGVPHQTYPLAPDYQGCGHSDPDHSYEGARVEFNGGRCDGWLRAGENDEFSIGYYTRRDLPFLGNAARYWRTCDRYFSAILAGTFPNRVYQHAAQTDRIANTYDISSLPTIWDRLADAGLDGRYYFSDLPFLALWGAKYLPIAHTFRTFLSDAAAGTLPQVAFLDPHLLGESIGISGDDHPYGDIRNGEVFLNTVYRAITLSPAWKNTVLIFNFDEWGGFFDHVPPARAPIPAADRLAGNQDGRRGFRTPCVIVSPYAPRARVSHTLFDHTSILRMIEWRWNLAPLTVRDATANNLALALDFSAPDLTAPQYLVPRGPYGELCLSAESVEDEWQPLMKIAKDFGW
jgi:phospholipase C